MATKRFSPPTKFRVGQRFVLVMDKHTGWASMDCQFGVVDGPPAYSDAWSCGSIDGSREDGSQSGWRYPVRVPGRPLQHFCEEHMRPIDGEELSTWDKFAKATGIDLRGAIIDLRASQEGTPPRKAVSQMHSPVQLDEERTALAREITYQLEPIFKELVDLSSPRYKAVTKTRHARDLELLQRALTVLARQRAHRARRRTDLLESHDGETVGRRPSTAPLLRCCD